jgi:4-hydroxythreonine-4-phosphate dehydrogenase
VAGELAALLRARRSMNPANERLSILMAPALPSQGRTTVGGCLFVHGLPLEETDIWQAEARTAQSNIPQLLVEAGLSCEIIDIETVRSGLNRLRQAVLQSAEQNDVIVCDAATDHDLHAIANASLGLPVLTALVGSAGLASQIPQAIGIAPDTEPFRCGFTPGPTLFVVGTAASVTRQQIRILELAPDIATFHASPAVLHNSPALQTQISQSLRSSRDVLLVLDGEAQCQTHEEQFLPQALSELIPNCAPFLGGLVATGGETARAVLDALGIQLLRVLGEVESGLPFSVADGWVRPLPIITKAGAFGSPHALVRCRDFLRQLERVSSEIHAEDSLLNRKS